MVKVKKDTISREAFEKEMEGLKSLVAQNPTDSKIVISAINTVIHRLVDYIDERDAELFRIPDWLNRDVTVTVQAKEIGG